MPSVFTTADRTLRTDPARQVVSLRTLLLLILTFSPIYGVVMGSYGAGYHPIRLIQATYSAIKVPLLLLATLGICFPSFFVLNTLLGLRDDFTRAMAGVLASQAVLAIVLASLAPLTAVWNASVPKYSITVIFNAVIFATASAAGQIVLWRHYRPLVRANPRHRLMCGVWLGVYSFVGTQMGYVLRPFIGNPDIPTAFFRPDAWGNAYAVIWQLLSRR